MPGLWHRSPLRKVQGRLIDKAMPSPVAAEMSRKGKPVIATIALTASHVGLRRNKKDPFGKKLAEEEYVTGLKFFVDNAPQPDLLGKAIEGPANNPALNQYPMIPLEKLEKFRRIVSRSSRTPRSLRGKPRKDVEAFAAKLLKRKSQHI